MARVNLTVKSRDKLKEDGFTVLQTVETYNAFTKRKHDLFGIFDVLAVGGGKTMAIQVTSRDNMSSRRKKILESPAFGECVLAGWDVELHGWYKEKNRWHVKLEVMSERED